MTQTVSTTRRTTWKYAAMLAGFALVSVGFLFLSRGTLRYYFDYSFTAYVIFASLFVVVLIRMRLKDLSREGRLHGILQAVAEKGLAAALVQRSLRRTRSTRGLLLRLSMLALLLFLLICVLAANDILFEENLRLLERFDWIGAGGQEAAVPIKTLYVATNGRGTESRLQMMLRVTKDLTAAGARVIVLDLPHPAPHPYYQDLVSEIQSAGDVVFAVNNDYFMRDPISWQSRNFYGPMSLPDTVVRNWGLVTAEYGNPPRTHRSIFFVPASYSHTRPPGGDTIPDVTIAVLRKWKNYPESLRPVRSGRMVLFGEYRIPVSSHGLAIAPYRFGPAMGPLKVMGVDGWDGGEFSYRWDDIGGTRTADDLQEFSDQIRGTIVLVSWYDPVEKNPGGIFMGTYPTLLALKDMMQDRCASVRDDLHIPATIAVLIASLLLIAKTRPLVAIPILVALGTLMIYGSAWLFWEKQVVFEVIYPAAGIALSVLLLPLAKISAEVEKEDA
ncbi:MAG TPA: hypothetical protein VMF59_03750 [Bacteroidota bacterium]|nr:hypothetical protein [Bacteroidota bacterium]